MSPMGPSPFDGAALKRVRGEAGLSLRDLSLKAGVSASLLSQIERGVTQPSISTLKRTAEALGISIFLLMPSEDGPSAGMVVRASRRRRVVLEHENLKYELLSPNARGKLEVWQGRLEPGATSGSEPSTHPSEEFILVLSGEMQITIGATEHVLERGDSIQYDGSQPHTIVALGTNELRFISALTPPTL